MYTDLMRSYLAAFVLALLFLFVVAVLGMLTCCADNPGRIKAAGALAIFAGQLLYKVKV